MFKVVFAAVLLLLLAAGTSLGLTGVAPPTNDETGLFQQTEEETEVEVEVEDPEDGGPPDFDEIRDRVQANMDRAQANMEAAAVRAKAANDHATAIGLWTACVAANAANPEDEPRDDSFDPKEGCGPKPPTPDGAPDNDVDEDAGPPEELGPQGQGVPDGAGPPDWIGGPPPWAGPGGVGSDGEE